jgi:hypothetical protein
LELQGEATMVSLMTLMPLMAGRVKRGLNVGFKVEEGICSTGIMRC